MPVAASAARSGFGAWAWPGAVSEATMAAPNTAGRVRLISTPTKHPTFGASREIDGHYFLRWSSTASWLCSVRLSRAFHDFANRGDHEIGLIELNPMAAVS